VYLSIFNFLTILESLTKFDFKMQLLIFSIPFLSVYISIKTFQNDYRISNIIWVLYRRYKKYNKKYNF